MELLFANDNNKIPDQAFSLLEKYRKGLVVYIFCFFIAM